MLKTPEFVVSIINRIWFRGMKILEIGCGPAFLRNIYGNDYIGTDITSEPYGDDLPRDIDIICSADNLLLDSNSVDIVVIKSAFFLFNDHARSLQEALRVLKIGGKIIIFDYNKRTQKGLQLKEGHTNYPCWTQWQLKKLIEQNGFSNLELLIGQQDQPKGLRKYYELIRQEILGTWAIVSAEKVII